MPVKKDADGRRYVEAEVEVPGSPEQVWRAIATGEGVSSWFVPTTIDGREGGSAVSRFGPGMDAVARITRWNPPRSFTAEAEAGPGEEGQAKVATEWIVEARDGGSCVVRVVHRWFADSDDWDGEFEGHAYGWASFFRILRLYLMHYPGRTCSHFGLAAFSKARPPETWRTFRSALTIDEASGRVASNPPAPPLSGVEVARVDDPAWLAARARAPQVRAALEGVDGEEAELLLHLDRPAPGLAHAFVMALGEQTMLSIRFFLYGDEGTAAAAEAERRWNDWLAARFPAEAPA
jgi:uncharacterized protein YndB with AHSA1/START domain